jgi:biotin operon repressor
MFELIIMEKEIQTAIELLKKNGYEIRSPKQVEELKKDWKKYKF